ncbi:peptide hydrolase [Favolaschia claudopus]|uniref:Peptide hydrolase n=1 Tax=Favolaschia claudopus TaxID=2862362 RepID=A0AAW0CIF3_9AGAR
MQIVEAIAKVFAFRTLPTTILVVAVYLVLFASVRYGDRVPAVPKNQNGLNLTQAYADLHHIARRPHPVLTHANDIVHEYILSRVRSISQHVSYIEVHDDVGSTASWPHWSGGPIVVYNQASNILVKIEGSDPDAAPGGGVLFSAHYDSVSTASGATDDGMGVATLIQLIEYFANNQPKRTAVFNINNGEEDGLNGAFTFLKHPWSNLTDAFLNLEGAAAGGRPLLFRGTSTPALRSFNVPHPHGNVLSADAFARGVIRSGTDYSVYNGAGMDGLDLAFYKGRSKYHTKYDAIAYTAGQERALWAMMESSHATSLRLLNDGRTHGSGSPPVYFDLFGAYLVVLSMDTLLIVNIVLLIVGPVLLIVLLIADAAVQHGRTQNRNGHVSEYSNNLLQQFWAWLISFEWLKGAWMWAKFWVAVLVTLGLQALLAFAYLKLNPFIVYSQPTLVLVSAFTLAYLSLVAVVRPNSNHLPEKQKHVMFLQSYIFTWILLVAATVAVGSGVGGVYFVTAWNLVVLVACVIGCIENLLGAQGSSDVHHVHYAPLPRHDDEEHPEPEADAEATETTPLIRPILRPKEESGAIGWWILQLVLAISVPVILVAHITILLVAATSQTMVDGSSATTVYVAIAVLVFMIALPVVPFTFKTHSTIAYLFIIFFILSTAANLLMFPFSQTDPLKVYFQQTVDLGNISSPFPQVIQATTSLTGVHHYVKDLIVPKLPSSIGQNVTCGQTGLTRQVGLETCSWNSQLLPSPDGRSHISPVMRSRWMDPIVTRLSDHSARIRVRGINTRGCRLYFDNKRITRHKALGWEDDIIPQFPPPADGVNQLYLWSREWEPTFTVDVEWEGDESLEGRVACEWAEYESGSIGVDSTTGKIPALEEVLTFFPQWATVTKALDGLVEAYVRFSI